MDVPLSLTTKSFAEVENFVQSYNKRLHLQKETFFQDSVEAVQQLIYANLASSFS